jgi:Right handed beta helix region
MGVQGTGSDITIRRSAVRDVNIGINATGSRWRIIEVHLEHIGDSGMILRGDDYVVSRSVIADTGLDRGITYGKHGIYLRVRDARITDNAITGFTDNGISARNRNAHIEGNTIGGGPIGIAWFQYDEEAGQSTWSKNHIFDTTSAGVYVSPSDPGGPTRESFVITGNRIAPREGLAMDLAPTQGTYVVSDNVDAAGLPFDCEASRGTRVSC